MGWTSQDDLINQITVNGKYARRDGSKLLTPVHTAGGWHMLGGLAGFPNASAYPGTDLVWSSCDEANGDGTTVFGLPHNGPVLPASKHILNIGANIVAAAGAPWQLKLIDLQGYYRLSTTNVTGTGSRVLINSNTFTVDAGTDLVTVTNDFKPGTKFRLTNSGGALPAGLSAGVDYWWIRVSATTGRLAASYADYVAGTFVDITGTGTGTHTATIQMPRYAGGLGCEAFFVVQTQPTAGGPNLSASDYTNPAGTSSRVFQGSPTMGATADAYAGRVLHSGNATGRYGPFLPRQGGDTGVARVNSFTWSGGTAYTGSGVVALCIGRPLCDIPVPVSGMWSERDFANQLPSFPEVEDGACLQWMLFGTGATTNNSPVNTAIDFGWGG